MGKVFEMIGKRILNIRCSVMVAQLCLVAGERALESSMNTCHFLNGSCQVMGIQIDD